MAETIGAIQLTRLSRPGLPEKAQRPSKTHGPGCQQGSLGHRGNALPDTADPLKDAFRMRCPIDPGGRFEVVVGDPSCAAVRTDLFYVENWSLGRNLYLL